MAQDRARWLPDLGPWLALAVVLSQARAGSSDQGPPLDPWSTGRPLAIAVDRGRASFAIPPSPARSKTLVIVSSLARGRGSSPIRLEVRSEGSGPPVRLAPQGTRRPTPLPLPPLEPTPSAVSSRPPSDRTFHLPTRSGDLDRASSYRAVLGKLRAWGRRVQVYVDEGDLAEVDAATLRDLVATFDDQVYPEAAARFGPATDVDRDGRFTILVSSALTRLSGGEVGVDGFVRGADLDLTLSPPFGNRCDMMALSTRLKAGPYLRTIVAHEYTHAVNFSRKALGGALPGPEEESWLDEGLAHLVEDAHGFSRANFDYRVSAYLSKPEAYRLVVDDYYAAGLFRSHGNRGATYLFLRWCVDRHGPGLVDALIRSPLRGVANLEAATGADFADLFRAWTVSLYLSGLDPAAEPEGAYRSIDLRGEFEDCILAGPRASSVSRLKPVDAWTAEGTSAHFTVVEGSGTVEILGPREAEVQVTVVPLPDALGRTDLEVSSRVGLGGKLEVEARVRELDGTAVRLGAIAWEPLVPGQDPRGSGFRRGGLDMLGIADRFGTSKLAAHGTLRSKTISLDLAEQAGRPLVFKAVGTDSRGRRVAAWTVLPPPG